MWFLALHTVFLKFCFFYFSCGRGASKCLYVHVVIVDRVTQYEELVDAGKRFLVKFRQELGWFILLHKNPTVGSFARYCTIRPNILKVPFLQSHLHNQ
jgi:hypothetical protein